MDKRKKCTVKLDVELLQEVQFDGLVGPTHNYAGLSRGNIASSTYEGQASNPKLAALESLVKMKFVRDLGLPQAFLPPQNRPNLRILHQLGFRGSDEEIISAANKLEPLLLRQVSSASAMWAANAATVVPSTDSEDSRVHFVPANLVGMFHRSIETETTTRVLRAIFAEKKYFEVHDALPASPHFSDEGAANHSRLQTSKNSMHLFAWGKSVSRNLPGPKVYPARQTLEASQALARLHLLKSAQVIFPKQHPMGIDAGAFHTDVLAVGNKNLFIYHELAFEDEETLVSELRKHLGEELVLMKASVEELSVKAAVSAYPFNSQVLSLPDGKMCVVAPTESKENSESKAFLDKVLESNSPIKQIHYIDLRQSMQNGGGPACLRLRVPLTETEIQSLSAKVMLTNTIYERLTIWVAKHYRDRIEAKDLADPHLARESMVALDELTKIIGLGNIYDFQLAR